MQREKFESFYGWRCGGDPIFAIGAINQQNAESMQGEVGRMLVCGSRDTPMGNEEIKFIHPSLIDKWNINDGIKGDKGDVEPSRS